MKILPGLLLLATMIAPAWAAKGKTDPTPASGVSLRISTETAPAGSVAQIKLSLTEPKPIIKTKLTMDGFDEELFDILGISLRSPQGEAWGVARYEKGMLQVEAASPGGALGATAEYPLLTIAVRVKGGEEGQMLPFQLDLAGSEFLNHLGLPYAAEVKPGGVVVGGTLAVENVLPGGGRIEAGGVFHITGKGFRQLERLQIEGAEGLNWEARSDELLEVFTPVPLILDGAPIALRNSAKERVDYYSYLRPHVEAEELTAFAASLVPLVAAVDLSVFELPRMGPEGAAYGMVALENAGAEPAEATLTLLNEDGVWLGEQVVLVNSSARVMRTVPALFPGASAGAGAWVRVQCTQPLRGMGLRVNEAESLALPVAPIY